MRLLKFQQFKLDLNTLLVFGLLAFIIYLGVWTRLPTINTPTVLDYDPFWFFRHAKKILENNFQVPKWDILSFYPPGRPTEAAQGWSYTMIIFYKILQFFDPSISFTKAAILSPLMMVALIPIPAFFLGKYLSGNNVGGLITALISVLTPAFIGVSMAGYSDSDAPVVFHFFLSVLSVFLVLRYRKIPFYAFAILANLAFAYTWQAGWLVLLMFFLFLPILVIFRLVEGFFVSGKLRINTSLIEEVKPLVFPIFFIVLVSNSIGYLIGLGSIFHSFFGGLAFTGLALALRIIFSIVFFLTIIGASFLSFNLLKKSLKEKIEGLLILSASIVLCYFLIEASFKIATTPLLVNISVAELQPINIFTGNGFSAVMNRIGILPTIVTILFLPFFVLYKLLKKEKISLIEIYLFLWAFISFYLISHGVRFSLLFSIAAAASSGYVIGNFYNSLKNRNLIIFSSVFGFIGVLLLMSVSDAIQIGLAQSGMMISQNWYDMMDWLKKNADKDSLIVTWWDPGHILAGYTGLKVHADGAHCSPQQCILYSHNSRIQDMGAAFSINDENKSIQILKKYMSLTPEQCEKVRETFGDIVPKDACKPVSEMYVIASSDLIGKYYWLSYFGSCITKLGIEKTGYCHNLSLDQFKDIAEGRNYIQFCFSGMDNTGVHYGFVINNQCTGRFLTLAQKDDKIIPVLNIPQQGIKNAIVRQLILYLNGKEQRATYENISNVDGLVWVFPGFGSAIFMDQAIRDSVFNNMFFFNGEGAQEFGISKLTRFKLVYQNPEIRLYKVIFS